MGMGRRGKGEERRGGDGIWWGGGDTLAGVIVSEIILKIMFSFLFKIAGLPVLCV